MIIDGFDKRSLKFVNWKLIANIENSRVISEFLLIEKVDFKKLI